GAVDLPPVPLLPSHVCAYCALNRCSINIADVYDSREFDFSGPRKYDSITGYRTRSMLVVPFENTRGDVIGVLQLINAQDENGTVIPFSHDLEKIIAALASQAAVCVTNTMYLQDIKELFQSFVQVMITAIDELSPYNVNHTRRITEFADRFLDYLNELYAKGEYDEHFDDNRREQLIMAAWMHDIGKLITPLPVMNKATRLGEAFPAVMARFTTAKALLRVSFLEKHCDEQEYLRQAAELEEFEALLPILNEAPYIDDDAIAKLAAMERKSYPLPEGGDFHLLYPKEGECLSVRKGTLTAEERTIMENHVVLTAKLLSKIHFGSDMARVPQIAAMHHEYLDGSGYPGGARGDELSTEVRILSILDI
ncbi:MAG: HD domain-containing phosphohydrolase, partial [Angelakisella sp.]